MRDDEVELQLVWARAVGASPAARERFASLAARHREPHRRYHTLRHVRWVVRHAEELAAHEPVGDLDAVVVAALYHDAVYDPSATDNEAASARLARRDLAALEWSDERADRVASMIEATSGHTGQASDDHAADPDTAVLLDADLSILGADPVAYQTYATGVRVEYGHVDDAAWRLGRAQVLRVLAARAPLYLTPTARSRWEARAKANVQAELATLEGP